MIGRLQGRAATPVQQGFVLAFQAHAARPVVGIVAAAGQFRRFRGPEMPQNVRRQPSAGIGPPPPLDDLRTRIEFGVGLDLRDRGQR